LVSFGKSLHFGRDFPEAVQAWAPDQDVVAQMDMDLAKVYRENALRPARSMAPTLRWRCHRCSPITTKEDTMQHELNRFIWAQERAYDAALAETRAGRRRGRWMWFVCPMYKGLDASERAQRYAIQSLNEARDYLAHPVLGARLREIAPAFLELETNDAHAVLGDPAAL
jgi:uncharacterized protein (DUF1810 family)